METDIVAAYAFNMAKNTTREFDRRTSPEGRTQHDVIVGRIERWAQVDTKPFEEPKAGLVAIGRGLKVHQERQKMVELMAQYGLRDQALETQKLQLLYHEPVVGVQYKGSNLAEILHQSEGWEFELMQYAVGLPAASIHSQAAVRELIDREQLQFPEIDDRLIDRYNIAGTAMLAFLKARTNELLSEKAQLRRPKHKDTVSCMTEAEDALKMRDTASQVCWERIHTGDTPEQAHIISFLDEVITDNDPLAYVLLTRFLQVETSGKLIELYRVMNEFEVSEDPTKANVGRILSDWIYQFASEQEPNQILTLANAEELVQEFTLEDDFDESVTTESILNATDQLRQTSRVASGKSRFELNWSEDSLFEMPQEMYLEVDQNIIGITLNYQSDGKGVLRVSINKQAEFEWQVIESPSETISADLKQISLRELSKHVQKVLHAEQERDELKKKARFVGNIKQKNKKGGGKGRNVVQSKIDTSQLHAAQTKSIIPPVDIEALHQVDTTILSPADHRKMLEKIQLLGERSSFHSSGLVKITTSNDDEYRLRVGNYRLILRLEKDKLTPVGIYHRRDAYS